MTAKNNFGAGPSAAGYLYQARMALALSLPYVNKDSNVEVSLERLDDVAFELDGAPLELLQTKHHINRVANLTNSSPDLWKTLRVWAEAVENDPSIPARTRLALITTAEVPEGSAAGMLLPSSAYGAGKKRDPKSAATLLTEIANASANKELKAAFAAFLNLIPEMRASLLSAVEVLGQQQKLTDLGAEIEEHLRLFAPKGKAAQAREMLEGWWWPRICSALVCDPPGAIAIGEIEAKLDDIREMLKRESLAIDFEHADPSDEETASYDGFRFIQQLKAVGATEARMHWAKRDYYRAYAQRSKWTREHAVFDGEIARFESRLIEEWEPRFGVMCDSNAKAPSDCATLREAGQTLYHWVETDARFPFRTATHRFLNVGSYHILADDVRVGWHRDFATLFGKKD
jgi:hypothetical protein